MSTAERSLRLLVDKWFAPGTATRIRVIRFARTRLDQRRCVRVEALRPEGSVGIFFFQHQDGMWRVFPPEAEPPAMCLEQHAG